MKKILIGLIAGFIIATPAGVFAWSQTQKVLPIRAYGCPEDDAGSCFGTINRFKDGVNTCYVTDDKGAISCIKD